MKTERIVVSFFAIVVGLAAAGGAFYFYQKTTNMPQSKGLSSFITPSPTPDTAHLLEVSSPKDESVSDKKTITITGKTTTNATLLISTENDDQIVKATAKGDFSTTVTLPDGTSMIRIAAIFPDGEEKQVTQTITYSTETF